jgi:hypothetical protein
MMLCGKLQASRSALTCSKQAPAVTAAAFVTVAVPPLQAYTATSLLNVMWLRRFQLPVHFSPDFLLTCLPYYAVKLAFPIDVAGKEGIVEGDSGDSAENSSSSSSSSTSSSTHSSCNGG